MINNSNSFHNEIYVIEIELSCSNVEYSSKSLKLRKYFTRFENKIERPLLQLIVLISNDKSV